MKKVPCGKVWSLTHRDVNWEETEKTNQQMQLHTKNLKNKRRETNEK